MCECIETIEKAINEDAAESRKDAELETALVLVGDSFARQSFIHATARMKKRNGEFSKKKYDFRIFFTYCPFCGKKIKE